MVIIYNIYPIYKFNGIAKAHWSTELTITEDLLMDGGTEGVRSSVPAPPHITWTPLRRKGTPKNFLAMFHDFCLGQNKGLVQKEFNSTPARHRGKIVSVSMNSLSS